ncbi:MAG: hypothetical protein JRC77_09415 [Deltaproteobacteria bacterium]|nr:hypothetical protein [Deltaproteobacteria bacterium]
MPTPKDHLSTLIQQAPRSIDLTDAEDLEQIRELAEALENSFPAASGLCALEEEWVQTDQEIPLSMRLGLKLALSRKLLGEIPDPVHVSLVFAVYKEHNRILKSEEHPHGEDFLRRKIRQLRWLFAPTPQHSWDLTVVDDGCPERSGQHAQQILDEELASKEEACVLFLEEAIQNKLSITHPLTQTSESQKGGSIHLGLWHATQTLRGQNHIGIFTDADLSTHLGQIGLIVDPIVRNGYKAAIGSRREPASVVIKAGARNTRGKLFIYLWKRLLPPLQGIIDTQCGFKAFKASDLKTWLKECGEKKFAFDIEMLLRLQPGGSDSIQKVAIAWIDSEAASTTTDLEPYLPMLQSAVRFYRELLPVDETSESFARLIESLDESSFQHLLENIPEEIANREPATFETFDEVSAEELHRRATQEG